MTGSGYGHSTEIVNRAIGIRHYGEYYKSAAYMEWVKYKVRSPPGPPRFCDHENQPGGDVDVLLNDHCANSNALSVVSFETNTPAGGLVTWLGSGLLRYAPPPSFAGYNWSLLCRGGDRFEEPERGACAGGRRRQPAPRAVDIRSNQRHNTRETTGRGVAGTLKGTASFESAPSPA